MMAPNTATENASAAETQKFAEILRNNGISDEVKSLVLTEPTELKGEHFASASIYAKIEFQDASIKPKNLFVKKFTNSASHTAMGKMMRIMEKESAFYNDFLPTLKEFYKKFNGCEDSLNYFPKCLYSDDEMVVLENLVLDDSFIMLSKEERQDLFTAKYVLNNLAKFHATSYAYIRSLGVDKFQENWDLICHESFITEGNPMTVAMFENGATACINVLKGHPVEGGEEAIDTLNELRGTALRTVLNSLKIPKGDNPFIVVNHGDCWGNNMLFKKDPETGKVNDHKFVDLQVTRFGTPSLDLGYYLYTSVKPQVRRAHLKEMLQHYYDSFEKTLEVMKMKMPLSFEEFFQDYKQNSQLGFFFNLSFISAMGGMKEINPEEMSGDAEEMKALFSGVVEKWMKNNPEQAAEIATEVVAVVREYKGLLA